MHKDIWTDRQHMLGNIPFEFYHYIDTVPPEVAFHQHPFYELFFFLEGDVNYTIEGKTYRLQPGDILLTNSLDIHRPEILPGRPYERVVIWIADNYFEQIRLGGDDLSACFQDAASKDYRLIRPSRHKVQRLKELSGQISAVQRSSRLGSFALSSAYLLEFLVEVCRCYYEGTDPGSVDVTENEKINAMLAYLNAHITDELSLDVLSKQFYMSKYYLSRQFKRYTGMSVYAYIMKKRLTISRDLLRGGATVTNACMECGFRDYSNYLKAFKREFGCNPSDWIGLSSP
jgi:AraC-like DNA-binding protein